MGRARVRKKKLDNNVYRYLFSNDQIGLGRQYNRRELVESFQRKWLNEFEKPKFFLSDQGKQYTSMVFRTFLSSSGIRQVFASSYNPTGNSVSERFNQMISFGLRVLRGHPIEHIIERIEFSINNTQN